MPSDHVYKVVELVGSSQTGVDDAIQNAIRRASQTLKHLGWFEVREIRGHIRDSQVGHFQVKLGIGFRVEEPGETAVE
jgi:flavin-binding protein dodecin